MRGTLHYSNTVDYAKSYFPGFGKTRVSNNWLTPNQPGHWTELRDDLPLQLVWIIMSRTLTDPGGL